VTTPSSHGAGTREPVVHGNRRVPGLWQRTLRNGSVVYEARLRIEGKDRRIVLEATTKFDAVREYEGLRADRNRGNVRENPLVNPTIGEVLEEWLAHMQGRVGIADARRRYAQSTVDERRNIARRHLIPLLGHKRIATTTTGDIRRFVAELEERRLAPMTCHAYLGILGTMFTFAVKSGYVERNPCKELARDDRPSRKRLTEPRYLTAAEVVRLLEHSDPFYRPMFAGMVYAALRVSEVIGLFWRDLDFAEETVTVSGQMSPRGVVIPPKTPASAASVPMAPALKRELLIHRARQAEANIALVHADRLVFVTRGGIGRPPGSSGRPYTISPVYTKLRDATDAAGLNPPGLEPVSPHDLRHTCIALALQSGATMVEASELARHESPAVTMEVYAGLTEDGRGRALKKMLEAGFGV
jgi:integrase